VPTAMACHHIHAIGALLLALPAALGKPPLLPRCTIAVAGANGRVGSAVCREILRSHPQVTVRALVRDAGNPWEGYGRLSYEVGAEEGKMDLRPAWALDEDGRFGQPASMEFDPDVQGNYGLDRLEIRECELRYRKDVDDVLSDVDAVVYCATAFNAFRQRLPDRLDEAGRGIAKTGMALFELRFGDALFGGGGRRASDGQGDDAQDEIERRRREARDKTADVEGLELALQAVQRTQARRAALAELTGGPAAGARASLPFVLVSAAAALGYDEDRLSGELQENEFGYRKRLAEASLRSSSIPHLVIRSAAIDDLRVAEGLAVRVSEDVIVAEVLSGAAPQAIPEATSPSTGAQEASGAGGSAGVAENAAAAGAVGVRQDDAKRRRIHPRDLARYIAQVLGEEAAEAGGAPDGAEAAEQEEYDGAVGSRSGSRTREVWTCVEGEF